MKAEILKQLAETEKAVLYQVQVKGEITDVWIPKSKLKLEQNEIGKSYVEIPNFILKEHQILKKYYVKKDTQISVLIEIRDLLKLMIEVK